MFCLQQVTAIQQARTGTVKTVQQAKSRTGTAVQWLSLKK